MWYNPLFVQARLVLEDAFYQSDVCLKVLPDKIKPCGPSLPRLPTIHVVRPEGSNRRCLRKENITICTPHTKGCSANKFR